MAAVPVPFVPISRQLLDSSVWETDLRVRVLWITLLMIGAEPARRGTVDMTIRSLAGRAAMSPEDTRYALRVLEEPDPESRTKGSNGRRIERIDPDREWGWRILNWSAYEADRERMLGAARKARQRERDAESDAAFDTSRHGASRIVTVGHDESRPVTPRHVEDEVEDEDEDEGEERESSALRRRPSPASLLEVWNRERGTLPEAKGLSATRETHARARLIETPDLDRWAAAVRRVAASPFCRGATDRGWRATFDWLLKPDTLLRIEEGKYDPPTPVALPGAHPKAPAGAALRDVTAASPEWVRAVWRAVGSADRPDVPDELVGAVVEWRTRRRGDEAPTGWREGLEAAWDEVKRQDAAGGRR